LSTVVYCHIVNPEIALFQFYVENGSRPVDAGGGLDGAGDQEAHVEHAASQGMDFVDGGVDLVLHDGAQSGSRGQAGG
jgi:hypothetical protein